MYDYKFFLEKLRSSYSISQLVSKFINIKKHGNEYIGLCPFHNEKSPSFTINDNKKFYHCFGCGAHGDIIKFVMEIKKHTFKEAIEYLAAEISIPLPVFSHKNEKTHTLDYLYKIHQEAASWFKDLLRKSPTSESSVYLQKRGINDISLEKFNIGLSDNSGSLKKFLYDKGYKNEEIIEAGLLVKTSKGSDYERFRGRIIFPITDSQNKVIAFGGRILNGNFAKYINSNESQIFNKSEVLYGEYLARATAREKNRIILVEGYIDVVMMHQKGFYETVATLGTSVTATHLHKLWSLSKNLFIFLDNDSPGKKAMLRLALMSLEHIKAGFSLKFVFSQFDKDPADLCLQFDYFAIENILNNAVPLSTLLWLDLKSLNIVDNNPEEISTLENSISLLLSKIRDKRIKENFRLFFKDKIWDEFRKKHKNTLPAKHFSALNLFHIYDLPLRTRLEYSFISILIHMPILLKNSCLLEEFLSFKFEHPTLIKISRFIFEFYNQNINHEVKLCKEQFKDSLQNKLNNEEYNFIFKNDSFFLDKTVVKNKDTAEIFCNIVVLKIQLITLQDEYENYLQKFTESSIIQSQIILEEIKLLKEKIEKLELLNYN